MADITISRFQLRRTFTAGYRPPALAEGEPFLQLADSKWIIGGLNGATQIDVPFASMGGGSGGGSATPFTVRRQVNTPTNGQSIFTISGGYTVGNLLVFVDGFALLAGSDYAATNGSTVTILSPALDAADRVEFVMFDGTVSGGGSGPANTDALIEGAANLYFTQARARASISVTGSLAYNAATGVVSYTAPALAPVATSGAYADLTGKPALAPVATSGSASDLNVGTLPASRLPLPSTSTLGGVRANVGGAGLYVLGIDPTTGALQYGTPAGTGGGGSGTVTSVAATSTDLTITGSPITTTGTLGFTLATVNANVGTFNNVTLNAKGLATSASNVAYLTANQTVALSGAVTGSGSTTITTTTRYDLSTFCVGKPAASEVIVDFVAAVAVSFLSGMTGSQAKATTAASAPAVWSVTKNGSQVATVTFAAAGTTGTFTAASAFSLVAGDRLRLIAPATQDAALADLSFTLAGTR